MNMLCTKCKTTIINIVSFDTSKPSLCLNCLESERKCCLSCNGMVTTSNDRCDSCRIGLKKEDNTVDARLSFPSFLKESSPPFLSPSSSPFYDADDTFERSPFGPSMTFHKEPMNFPFELKPLLPIAFHKEKVDYEQGFTPSYY